MTSTLIDVEVSYSRMPSGCGDCAVSYWTKIELPDDNLTETLDELHDLISAWVERSASNKKDFGEDAP